MRKVPRFAGWALAGAIGVALLLAVALPRLRGLVDGPVGPLHEVRHGPFVHRIHAEGTLVAVEATKLGPPPTTRQALTIAWLAPDGSNVAAGDVVIRFDPTQLEKNLEEGENEQAQSDSRISKQKIREDSAIRNLGRDADVAELELGYAREFQSRDPEIYSRVEVIESEIDEELAAERKDHAEDVQGIRGELAEVELDLLGIERRMAELKIRVAREGLELLEVRAPHDGIFVLTKVWGNTPEVGQVVWGGNVVAEIPRLEKMEAEIFVLEADAGGLEPGLPAHVTLESHPGELFEGTVRQVDALAQPRFPEVPVQYFGAKVELAHTDPAVMKPGQRVRAELLIEQRDDAISVPRQAIFEFEGRTVVYARRGGGFEPLAVELGPASLGRVVIDAGLEAGVQVALFDPTRPGGEEPAGNRNANGPTGGLAGSFR